MKLNGIPAHTPITSCGEKVFLRTKQQTWKLLEPSYCTIRLPRLVRPKRARSHYNLPESMAHLKEMDTVADLRRPGKWDWYPAHVNSEKTCLKWTGKIVELEMCKGGQNLWWIWGRPPRLAWPFPLNINSFSQHITIRQGHSVTSRQDKNRTIQSCLNIDKNRNIIQQNTKMTKDPLSWLIRVTATALPMRGLASFHSSCFQVRNHWDSITELALLPSSIQHRAKPHFSELSLSNHPTQAQTFSEMSHSSPPMQQGNKPSFAWPQVCSSWLLAAGHWQHITFLNYSLKLKKNCLAFPDYMNGYYDYNW